MQDNDSGRRGAPMRRVVLGVVAAVALIFEILGWAGLGWPGGLLMAGITLFLIGVGATIVGRARWAFIAGRKVGAVVALVGLAGLVAGGVNTPRTAGTSDTSATSVETPAVGTTPAATSTPAPDTTAAPSAPTAVPADGTSTGTTALAALAGVPVKGRAPQTGYSRDQFGPAWSDTDHNGCDTRNDILARDLSAETFKPGTHDCAVATGVLADPYSGSVIQFTRGQSTSEAVQIDHVVALSDAWQKGAQGWDVARRTAFANDPLNLLAVDGPLNMQKGDGDAATWLPPNRGYRCAYVARQVAVKVHYGLWMTQAEKTAIAGILATCPDQPLPAGGAAVPAPAPAPAPVPAPAPAPAPVPAPAPAPPGDVYYPNCSAARAAGAAPIYRGQPGYRSALDRDDDGVACES